jgi:hypothetical protein
MKRNAHTFLMHSRYVRHARRDAVRHGTSRRPVALSLRARIERAWRGCFARANVN